MKHTNRLKSMVALLLLTHTLGGSAQPNNVDSPAATESASIAAQNGSTSSKTVKRSGSYSGYSVDGRTSASVLTAKRSHAVSKQDETGLAIYSGLMVIGLIVFFVHALSKKK
ncbi:MAG: hypothetical protein ACXV7J_08585 [Methylomonas sp.]